MVTEGHRRSKIGFQLGYYKGWVRVSEICKTKEIKDEDFICLTQKDPYASACRQKNTTLNKTLGKFLGTFTFQGETSEH